MEEKEIIKRLKSGDNETFRMLIEEYQKFVLNCAYKFLRNKENAEDITQEVFIEVYKSIGSFRAEAKLSTWIYRITVTKSLNYLKSLTRKKRFGVIFSLFEKEDMEEKYSDSGRGGPAEIVENKDRAEVLQWALAKLSVNQRIAFTLSKYDEMSYEEISLVLNTSISSVESLIHRAKEKLKIILYDYYKKQF